ncbi:kinesin-like protein KIN-12D isoform X3 [Cajanus cajan]|uniref:kinesin-like protein KIN-12D isoform X3 n=1 Tax=Cajanus cajan TaxID=3821 RepID=UPI00098DA3F1|nr:kinesin-like protein KIN-12D isoform X3 [Cajanus cajan]
MAVMEITAVAEKDAELRKSAFKPNSPACKAVVDQVVKIIEKADSKLLDQLRRYQEFYEEGEREILLTEVSSLREQLLQYHGRNSIQGNSNHDIEPQKTSVAYWRTKQHA